MRKFLISILLVSALLATLDAGSAVAIFGPSPSGAQIVTDLHQPLLIAAADQVIRRMP
jgi:hypothetical protein